MTDTRIISKAETISQDITSVARKTPTQEQLSNDAAYHKVQIILSSLLDAELISLDEFNKITELNRQSFSPYLAEIMPKTLEK